MLPFPTGDGLGDPRLELLLYLMTSLDSNVLLLRKRGVVVDQGRIIAQKASTQPHPPSRPTVPTSTQPCSFQSSKKILWQCYTQL